MNPTTKRMIAILGLVGAAVTGAPVVASAGGATLYELTENMKVVQRGFKHRPAVERRIATAAISGTAERGTPLCPAEKFESGQFFCVVNVQGSDNVSLRTGLGTLTGRFTTVIQGDNPVDGPEAVVLTGEFEGRMDFSPAILNNIPFGTVTGKLKADGKGRNDRNRKREEFIGVFRLPFAGNAEVEVQGVKTTLRRLFCPASPNPDLDLVKMYGGVDLAYLDFDLTNMDEAIQPNGKCLNIQPNELSLGAPLVRFDVKF
jgi:hypothetical protein